MKTFPGPKGSEPSLVLRGIDLEVGRAEFVAIVGPSGSGKSTLLHCLAGLEQVSSGRVMAFGHELAGLNRNALSTLRRDHIGFVFQAYNLIPSLSVLDNVNLPGRLAHQRGATQHARKALASVDLTDFASALPQHLSGGQQQRVAIARAIASRVELVFADEPTGALDTENGQRVLALLRELVAAERRTVVMVTHDLDAAALADRVVVMRDGMISAQLTGADSNHTLSVLHGKESKQ